MFDEDVSRRSCSSYENQFITNDLVCDLCFGWIPLSWKAGEDISVESCWRKAVLRWMTLWAECSFVFRRNTCWAYVEYISCALIWVWKEYQLKALLSNVCISGFLNGYIFVQRESEAAVFPVRVCWSADSSKEECFDISQPEFGLFSADAWRLL